MKITLSTKVYTLEAVLNASYIFIDRAYISLDINSKGDKIYVFFKPKERMSAKKLVTLKDEFMNELLFSSLRYNISRSNKKLREYIVGRALYAGLPSLDGGIQEEEIDFTEDPLGIAIPWEEKYGKEKKGKKVKNAAC